MQNIHIVGNLLGCRIAEMQDWQAKMLDEIESIKMGGVQSEHFKLAMNIFFENPDEKAFTAIFAAYPEYALDIVKYLIGYNLLSLSQYAQTAYRFFLITSIVSGVLNGFSFCQHVLNLREAKEEALKLFALFGTEKVYSVPDLPQGPSHGTFSNLVADFLRGETPETLDLEKFLEPVMGCYGNLPNAEKIRWNEVNTFNARLINEFVYKWFSNLPLSKKMSALSWISCGKKRQMS